MKQKKIVLSLSYDKEVGPELFKELVEAYNKLEEDQYLYIYWSSYGGEVSYGEAIIHLINDNIERTVLIGNGEMYSAGFDVFFRSRCERKILPGTTGMVHFAMVSVTLIKNSVAKSPFDKLNMDWSNEDFKKRIDYYSRLGLTKKELNAFKKGEDVYFSETRLNELLANDLKQINERYF